MGNLRSEAGGWLASGSGAVSGSAAWVADLRHAENYAWLEVRTPAASAIVSLQAASSPSGQWYEVARYTAVAAGITAQISAFYPFVRAIPHAIYSGGGNTGYPMVYYNGGLS